MMKFFNPFNLQIMLKLLNINEFYLCSLLLASPSFVFLVERRGCKYFFKNIYFRLFTRERDYVGRKLLIFVIQIYDFVSSFVVHPRRTSCHSIATASEKHFHNRLIYQFIINIIILIR